MKNIINEKPSETLTGRLKASELFVKSEDIKNKKILDIGCGYGWFEMHALRLGATEIVGCEPTEIDLDTIRKNVSDSRVKTLVGTAVDLPFGNSEFDTVVVWEVIEHIPPTTEQKMFDEISRILKPNGKLYLSTPFANILAMVFDPAWWLVNHRHYSIDTLKRFGSNSKLEIEEIKVAGKFWLLIDILNMYISKWVFKRGKFFKVFFDQKVEEEYSINNGWVNIFVSYRKS